MEFRWSLRSIDRYGKNIDRIFVVGWCPDWLSDDIIKIPYESNVDPNDEIAKNWNIAKKLLFAAENSDISEEFLVSMDDHFYVTETDFDNYPYYASNAYGGFLPTERTGSVYNEMMYDFGKFLEEKKMPTIYFTLHRNMHVSKSSINACMEIIKEAENNGKPMEIFTLLNNYRFSKGEITPTFVKDIKLFNGGDWYLVGSCGGVFSTSDTTMYEGLFVLMDGMFSDKCKYEKERVVEQKSGDDLRVAIFCICKHEEHYIDEWIDYYLKLGADDLYILDNNVFGNDAMKNIIAQRNNEHIKYIDIRGYKFYQTQAYNKLYAQVRSKYDWIAFIDADEFVEFEDKEATIKSFLKSNYKFSLVDQVRHRKNAFEIMMNGDIYVIGIGGYDGTNASASTSSTLQTVLQSLTSLINDNAS